MQITCPNCGGLHCSSKFVGFDPACGVWHRFLCACVCKAGSAPAMYGTFPCVAREISYLSSFVLPHLLGLLLKQDHCVNAGQWNPQDGSDPPFRFDPGIGALCKRRVLNRHRTCHKKAMSHSISQKRSYVALTDWLLHESVTVALVAK